MTLEFQHLFASERVRRWKIERYTAVDNPLLGIEERAEGRMSWFRQAPQHRLGNMRDQRTGYPDYTDPAFSGGGRYSGNRILCSHRKFGFSWQLVRSAA